MMEAVNAYFKLKETHGIGRSEAWTFALESLLQVLAPFAPHITEELWSDLGHMTTIHKDNLPQWDNAFLTSDMMTIIVQVNGKLRAKLDIAKDTKKDVFEARAFAPENVAKYLAWHE